MSAQATENRRRFIAMLASSAQYLGWDYKYILVLVTVVKLLIATHVRGLSSRGRVTDPSSKSSEINDYFTVNRVGTTHTITRSVL